MALVRAVAASEDQMHQITGARKGTWALISGRFKLHRQPAAPCSLEVGSMR